MRKSIKRNGLIVVYVIIIFISIFTIISCKPWVEIIKGVGMWGMSRYGEAVFGEERKGTPGENLRSQSNKEGFNLWK